MVGDEKTAPDLDELLAGVLTDGAPDTELLLEYIRSPEMMDPDARSGVEAYLDASPAHRDRLKVLRNLAFLDDVQAATPARVAGRGEGAYAGLPLPGASETSAGAEAS